MRRPIVTAALCLTGCATSPIYVPGLHPSAPMGSKGSVSASYVLKAPSGSEIRVSTLLTERWFISGRHGSTDDGPALGSSQFDLAVGVVTRDSSAQVQHSIGFTEGDGESAIAGAFDFMRYEGAPYKAFANYTRLYYQRAAMRMFHGVEVGGSARISAVRVTNYRRLAGTRKSNGAVGSPYDRDTTFTGRLFGFFTEPSIFIGLNFGGVRVAPQLSLVMPLTPTAFGAVPVEAGITFSIDSDVFKPWLK